MRFFGETGPEYDKRKKDIKDLKGAQDKDDKKERRRLKRLSRRERQTLAVAAGKGKVKQIISRTGEILAPQVIREIPEYAKRLKNGKCIYCGTSADRPGYVHQGCMKVISDMPSAHEINLTNQTPKGVKGIPAGQNINGIINCDCGHRIWPGSNDCHMGCVAYISQGKKCIHG